MADHDIQKSQNLLKRLAEEMVFLSHLLAQMDSLSFQIKFVSANAKKTWYEIDKIHENYKQGLENE